MYLDADELYFILVIGGFALALLIAVPVGAALARLIQWMINRVS